MGTQRTKVTLYGVLLDIAENLVELSSQYMGQWRRSKMGIATRDIILQVTMFRKYFLEIPDILMCWGQEILIILEGH